MARAPEDRLFARWCNSRDAQALAAMFDRTAPRLRHVAAHLCKDPNEADDLVQATYLEVLEGRAADPGGEPVLPWLLGILANRARRRWRDRRRRLDADRLPERSAEPDPALLAERNEIGAWCRTALTQLPEPYGPMLSLHLLHGLSAREIAEILRRPAGTVRTQIVRGMELLRKSLPTGVALSAAVATVSAQGLGRIREMVVARAAELAAAASGTVPAVGGGGGAGAGAGGGVGGGGGGGVGGGGGGGVGMTLGVLLMNKSWLLVSGLLLAGFCAWFAYPSPSASARHPAPLTAGESSAGGAHPAPAESLEQASNEGARRTEQRVDAPGEAGYGSLSIHCTWQDDDSSYAERYVSMAALAIPEDARTAKWLRTDTSGRIHLAEVLAGSYELTAGTGRREITIEAGRETPILMQVPATMVVAGRVLDARGEPVPQADVKLLGPARLGPLAPHRDMVGARTVADGSYRLHLLPGETTLWAQCPGHAPSAIRELSSLGSVPSPLDFVLPAAGLPVRGQVVAPDGQPLAGADVAITVDEGWITRVDDAGAELERQPAVLLTTGQAGRFECREIPAGKHIVWASAEGFALTRAAIVVDPRGPTHVEVRMSRGAVVRGRVLDEAGQALPLVQVSAFVGRILPGVHGGVSHLRTGASSRTDARGEYRIECLPDLDINLSCVNAGVGYSKTTRLGEGEELVWNPAPDPHTARLPIRGVLSSIDGEPLADWRITLTGSPSFATFGQHLRARTDANGRFAFPPRAKGHYQLFGQPADQVFRMAGRRVAWPPPHTIDWRLPFDPETCASFVGQVVHPDGRPPASIDVMIQQSPLVRTSRFELDGDGRFKTAPFPPGRWHVSVTIADYGSLVLGDRELQPGQDLDLGRIELAAKGRLTILLEGPDGARVEPLELRLVGATHLRQFHKTGDGGYRTPLTPPGAYRLTVRSAAYAFYDTAVEVPSGQERTVHARLHPATPVRVQIHPAETPRDRWRGVLQLVLQDSAKRILVQDMMQIDAEGFHTYAIGLPPGVYRFSANQISTDHRGEVEVEVPPQLDQPLTVQLKLRRR